MRRAKIVCTMGPAVEAPDRVKLLIEAGMNMARLNLSHGSYDEHQFRLDNVRAAALAAEQPVAILVDLQGPKIRLGRFADGPHDLARGDIFTITTDEIEGTKERVGTTFKGLPGDCKPGDRLLIDDGKVAVEVIEVKGNDVITKCVEPGAVSNNKGINLPGVAVSVPALSEKDKEDLYVGLGSFRELERWNWSAVSKGVVSQDSLALKRSLWRLNHYWKFSRQLSSQVDFTTATFLQFPINQHFFAL